MILGHWYLVIPSMQVRHLQSIAKVHIASLVVRIVVVAAAVFVAIALWQPGMGPNFRRYILSIDGIFFWQRVLFGLAGPALLSYLTWETAKIRSTQSATGILYVDFFTVVVGEVLSKYLLLATRARVVHCRIGRRRPMFADCTAVRNLCNFSLRTASGPEGSSAK